MACNPVLASVAPQKVGADNVLMPHSDDVRAVTCPECRATPEFKAVEAALSELAPV